MKYYAAVGDQREISAVVVIPPVRMLCSFHYFKKKKELVKELVDKGYEIFIDSGAFSAHTQDVEINIDDYCSFIKFTGSGLYAGLDVIGDAKQTRLNTEYMIEKFGLNPIPTFHLGGEVEDLYRLFDYPYIALGGLVFSSNIMKYCDEVWGRILREKPNLKVHGFGLTNLELMERYPWYSVDSSSYKGCRRFGRQSILWGENFEFKTVQEKEYWLMLEQQGYKGIAELSNNERYFLYDFHSVQSYKIFAAHLKEVNKIKDFSYLTAQHKMF